MATSFFHSVSGSPSIIPFVMVVVLCFLDLYSLLCISTHLF